MYANYKVGLISAIKDLPSSANGKKLRSCTIDVGEEEEITVVTNAPNVRENSRICVACISAICPAGSDPSDGSSVTVTKTTVAGTISKGIICDSVMLCWKGGAEGIAMQIPEGFALGSEPPYSKPRMDGTLDDKVGATSDLPAVEVKGLFEKKLTKEEKKAAANAAREKKRKEKAEAKGGAEVEGGEE